MVYLLAILCWLGVAVEGFKVSSLVPQSPLLVHTKLAQSAYPSFSLPFPQKPFSKWASFWGKPLSSSASNNARGPVLLPPILNSTTTSVELRYADYIWPKEPKLRLYLVASLVLMYYSKWFNIKIPFILQNTIDSVSKVEAVKGGSAAVFRKAVSAIIFYCSFRAISVILAEIKTCLFSHVWNDLIRKYANNIFSHMHSLDSNFHMLHPSGILSVAYVRAIRGFQSIIFQTAFSVIPTVLELIMVAGILFKRFGVVFSSITIATFFVYSLFTMWVTKWRVTLRKRQVEVDNARNAFLIDSFLHHEVRRIVYWPHIIVYP
jgi:ABC-type multidrug transport system fused ATPase/permease subunit